MCVCVGVQDIGFQQRGGGGRGSNNIIMHVLIAVIAWLFAAF